MVLTIPNTRDVFNYHLKGTGEEPCAKEHLILECRARQVCNRMLKIQNNTKRPIKYAVISDIENFSGKPHIIIPK